MLPNKRFKVETPNGDVNINVDVIELSPKVAERYKGNAYQLCRFYTSWLALLADSPLEVKPSRILLSFRKELLECDPKELIMRYSTLADGVLEHSTLYGSGSETGEYLPAMRKTPIYREYMAWKRSSDPKLLSYILTWLWFGKKLDIEDPELHATALRGWYEVEEKLSSLVLPDLPLRAVFDKFFPPVPELPLVPHFGPKTVAEAEIRGTFAKSENLRGHPRLDYVFTRQGNAHEHLGYREEIFAPSVEIYHDGISSDRSRVRFAKKNIRTARTICQETNSFMYGQQHVRHMLEARIQGSLLSQRIKLEDQSVNRQAALEGSIAGLIDTLDLSQASDSVSVDLVRMIFPPGLLLHLLATRTTQVQLPDGETFTPKKFAPMGSAVCFPVQCMIYAVVLLYASLKFYAEIEGTSVESLLRQDGRELMRKMFHRHPGGTRKYSFTKLEPVSVYGDDLCCDTRVTPEVVSILTSIGFSVNLGKSFTGGQCFRESCGGFYFAGNDVTPLFFRVKAAGEELTPTALASGIAAANAAGNRRFTNLQRYLIQMVLWTPVEGVRKPQNRKNWIPFVSDANAYGIYLPPKLGFEYEHECFRCITVGSENVHLTKRRPNTDYQTTEVRIIGAGYTVWTRHDSPALDRYLYTKGWGTALAGDGLAWGSVSYREDKDMDPRHHITSPPSLKMLGDSRVEGRKLAMAWRWITTP